MVARRHAVLLENSVEGGGYIRVVRQFKAIHLLPPGGLTTPTQIKEQNRFYHPCVELRFPEEVPASCTPPYNPGNLVSSYYARIVFTTVIVLKSVFKLSGPVNPRVVSPGADRLPSFERPSVRPGRTPGEGRACWWEQARLRNSSRAGGNGRERQLLGMTAMQTGREEKSKARSRQVRQ
eukprot:757197-Hanusia_phi.AAC.2